MIVPFLASETHIMLLKSFTNIQPVSGQFEDSFT